MVPPFLMVRVRASTKGEDWLCEVDLEYGGQHSRHSVAVKRADLDRWGDGTERENVERLVARSFDFLLEHEPPGSILATFDLSVIQTYFPDFDSAIKRQA